MWAGLAAGRGGGVDEREREETNAYIWRSGGDGMGMDMEVLPVFDF